MKYDQQQIEEFVNGFVQAMLFAENDDKGDPLDGNFSGGDIEKRSFERIKADCIKFMKLAGKTLDCGELEQHGMDFFYSRNGHGEGFFYRDYPKKDIEKLRSVSKKFPEIYPYVNNGEVYCE